jgi:hypothetical protein
MQPKDVCELLITEDEAYKRQQRPKLSRKAAFLTVLGALGVVLGVYSIVS